MNQQEQEERYGIVWSCVMRDSTILAEAGEEESTSPLVIQMAQELVQKKPTPGWEHLRGSRKLKLRGIKFHVYEYQDHEVEMIWSFGCLYDPSVVKQDQAKSFLEKLVYMTDGYWRESPEWRRGDTLVAQTTFAPILYQRMQEVTYMGRMAMVNEQVDGVKEIMAQNIDALLEREQYLMEMEEQTSALQEMSKQFKKRTQRVKRYKMWQNAKHGVVIGTAVTAGTAIVVVPPIIALL